MSEGRSVPLGGPALPAKDQARLLAAVAVAGQLAVMIDVAAVNVAAPSIRVDLGFRASDLQWVASAYTLTFAGLLILGGRLADVRGPRSTFAGGVALFTTASALVGLAPGPAWIVTARALQGCGAAMLSPSSLALILGELTGRIRDRAISAWAASSGVGGGLGVFLGGLLTDTLSWRWIFFLNIPVGLAAVVGLGRIRVPGTLRSRRGLDLPGAVAITLTISALTLTVSEAAQRRVLATLAAMAITTLLGTIAWIIERRAPDPVLRAGILRQSAVLAANLEIFLLYVVVISCWFLLAFYIQVVLGRSAFVAGVGVLPQAFVIAFSAAGSAALARRVGRATVLAVGLLIAASGLWFMFGRAALAPAGGYVLSVLVPLVLLGVGLGLSLPSLVHQGAARTTDPGFAAAVLNTSRQFGSAVGLACIYTVGTGGLPVVGASGRVSSMPSGYRFAALIAATVASTASIGALAIAFREGRGTDLVPSGTRGE